MVLTRLGPTAFFTFLRANLVLPPSAMSSQASTPMLEPQALPPTAPSPLATNKPATAVAAAAGVASALDDIPTLSLDVLTTREDKVAALRLVADSIAQQRQQASLNLVFHPLCLAALAAALAVTYRWAWVARDRDLGLAMSVASGVVMTYLLTIRYFASGYLQLAEALRWDWLVDGDGGGGGGGEEDLVIGTRFGDEMIGALVLRLEPSAAALAAAGANRKKMRALGLRGGRGVVRAWTMRQRYRGKGIGGDMLHEAVRVTRERCGRDAEVGFAQEHANSAMVLPEMFNAPFRRRERRAAQALESVLAEWEGNKRKR